MEVLIIYEKSETGERHFEFTTRKHARKRAEELQRTCSYIGVADLHNVAILKEA